MPLIRYQPPAPLDSYIQCFWYSERREAQVFREHMLPGGSAQLIFALHESPFTCVPKSPSMSPVTWSRGVVHGPQRSYYTTGPKPCGAVAGVSFRPGAAGAILGVPMSDLTDGHIPIDALWGQRARTLHDQLLAAANPTHIFALLEQALRARLARPILIHPAVAHALVQSPNPGSPLRVADVQRETGYSNRHFIALFRSAVGLTPKHYYRVQRFKAALQLLAGSTPASLASVAASVGYFDQSHLTREFRDLAGIAPTQYSPMSSDSTLHHQVLG